MNWAGGIRSKQKHQFVVPIQKVLSKGFSFMTTKKLHFEHKRKQY